MKVLIIGCDGQLGKELFEALTIEDNYEVIGMNKSILDITDFNSVKKIVSGIRPDVIINTAAYTDVDGCENNFKDAYAVNSIGVRNLAVVANEIYSKLIHISTDFVFNGMKSEPYFENDSTSPISVYGRTKLDGEWEIRNNSHKYFIIRTSWLYGKYGKNFVKTIARIASENNQISVVYDQVGSPTYTKDLIEFIKRCIHSDLYGLYHFSNEGNCSWHDFACEITRLLGFDIIINKVTSKDFNRVAKRPSYSVLDKSKAKVEFNMDIRSWQDALSDFINKDYKEDFR